MFTSFFFVVHRPYLETIPVAPDVGSLLGTDDNTPMVLTSSRDSQYVLGFFPDNIALDSSLGDISSSSFPDKIDRHKTGGL